MRSKRKAPYAGKGFVPSTVRGPKALYDYLWSLTEDIEFAEDAISNEQMRRKAHHFIVHIYRSIKVKLAKKDSTTNRDDGHLTDLYVPIYSRLIQKEFGRDFDVTFLRDKRLIKLTAAKNLERKSRYYSLPPKLWQTATEIENKVTSDAWLALTEGTHKRFIPFNLINGQRIRTIERSVFSTETQGFKTPDLVIASMKAISPCVFNPKHVGRWVDDLEKTFLREKRAVQERTETGEADPTTIKDLDNYIFRLEKKYLNERLSQQTILYQQPELLEYQSGSGDILYQYRAAYKTQVSGRLTEIGGGLQNASRVFKFLAFKDINDCFNYDLKGSQANILIQELEKCGIDASWIKNYMSDSRAKYTYAKKIGTDTNTWKTCLYATFMGSFPLSGSAIHNALVEHFENENLANAALKKFRSETKDLLKATKLWRKRIISPAESPYTYYSRNGGLRHWKNACGMKHKNYGIDQNGNYVKVEDTRNGDKELEILKSTANAKRELAAFILQGQEACFIHHLTLLCAENRIKVLRNEHDGIITNKEIPRSLIKGAVTNAKLKGAELDQKPLASQEDLDTASRLIERTI